MERIQFIEHRGKRILHLDFRNTKPDEIVRVIDGAKRVIAAQPARSVRTLTDVTDMAFDSKATQALKEFASHNAPYVNAAAVVGITGLKQIIYNAVIKFSGRNLVVFDTSSQAKEWLATQ